jgi:hypothetical protein
MAKKLLMIDHIFSCVSKDERFVSISHDLEVFNAEHEKEQATPKPSVLKKNVRRHRKEVKLNLLKPKLEKTHEEKEG